MKWKTFQNHLAIISSDNTPELILGKNITVIN
nr:MAG TPA: hypothetical protein [Caudoviricetes sp.]